MKKEWLWLIAGLVVGYLIYTMMKNGKNGNGANGNGANGNGANGNGEESGYLFKSGRRLYSTNKLSNRQSTSLGSSARMVGCHGWCYSSDGKYSYAVNNCGECPEENCDKVGCDGAGAGAFGGV